MTRTAHITINDATVSTAKAIMAAARTGPLVILTGRAWTELRAELGGSDAAMRHLLRVAENVGTPIGVNFETGEDTSSSAFLAPRSWTQERLRGWIAGHHEVIETIFGKARVRDL
jgi:hypothetical protein